jgi:threonine synthase
MGGCSVSAPRQHPRSTSYSGNILGLDRGFDELERSGDINARPRLFAVQAANCAAFAAVWAAGGDQFVPFSLAPTVADGIASPKPVRVAEVVRALRRSKGGVVAVFEEEIAPALAALGRSGFVEPTADGGCGADPEAKLRDGTMGRTRRLGC